MTEVDPLLAAVEAPSESGFAGALLSFDEPMLGHAQDGRYLTPGHAFFPGLGYGFGAHRGKVPHVGGDLLEILSGAHADSVTQLHSRNKVGKLSYIPKERR